MAPQSAICSSSFVTSQRSVVRSEHHRHSAISGYLGLDKKPDAADDIRPTTIEDLMHNRTVARVLLPALMLVAASAAHGQFDQAQPGTRVRIAAPGIVAGRYVGTVLARQPGQIRVGSPDAQPIDIPIDRITSLELSRGSSRWAGVGRGAVWGTGIGFLVGLASAASGSTTDYNYNTGRTDTLSRGEIVAYMTFSGLITGGLIGALIPKEQWERFDIAPRTGIDPRRRRLQLGFSVGY